MSDQLLRLLQLAQKTGDKLVVYDPSSRLAPYVILGIDAYENLLSHQAELPLTEGGLSDKITPDIDFWQNQGAFVQNKPNFSELAVSPIVEEISTELEAEETEEAQPITETVLPWAEETEAEPSQELSEPTDDELFEANETSIVDAGFSPVGSILESRLAELQLRLSRNQQNNK
ncbi:MAG: hypothetical protein WCO55_03240 [Candidatus Falkowbacteria bacterium]